MTTITLTLEQQDAIAQPYVAAHIRRAAQEKAEAAKAYAALQHRTDARVERADQRTAEWKQRYSEARKNLLAAHAEIATLKRRLRNGEWE